MFSHGTIFSSIKVIFLKIISNLLLLNFSIIKKICKYLMPIFMINGIIKKISNKNKHKSFISNGD